MIDESTGRTRRSGCTSEHSNIKLESIQIAYAVEMHQYLP